MATAPRSCPPAGPVEAATGATRRATVDQPGARCELCYGPLALGAPCLVLVDGRGVARWWHAAGGCVRGAG